MDSTIDIATGTFFDITTVVDTTPDFIDEARDEAQRLMEPKRLKQSRRKLAVIPYSNEMLDRIAVIPDGESIEDKILRESEEERETMLEAMGDRQRAHFLLMERLEHEAVAGTVGPLSWYLSDADAARIGYPVAKRRDGVIVRYPQGVEGAGYPILRKDLPTFDLKFWLIAKRWSERRI